MRSLATLSCSLPQVGPDALTLNMACRVSSSKSELDLWLETTAKKTPKVMSLGHMHVSGEVVRHEREWDQTSANQLDHRLQEEAQVDLLGKEGS